MLDQYTIPPHEIVIVQTERDRQECYDVRINVFHLEQNFPLETEIDTMDDTATHFLLRITPSLMPVGTIRVYKLNGSNCYKLSRLAVLKDYRGFKFGRELVLALHNWVRQDAARAGDVESVQVVCHSQLPVKGFYAKFGYEPEGAEFDEDGDPHQKMVLRLLLSN